LQGYLDEPEDLAAKLRLPRDASAATLAHAAIERFGEAAPAQMIGEWSCALWRSAPRRLTLVVSMAVRDPLLYAMAGSRVAVAPDLRRLTRLDWVDGEIDAEGLLLHLGRQRLRRMIGDRTTARGVKAVENGTCVTIRFGTCHASAAPRFKQASRWRGGFDDAMTEVEALLRKIMRQRLARRDKTAFLLSGGLDSSSLSLLGSAERRPGQEILLLSSAAPPESGWVDETSFAQIVADCLRLNIERVTPAPEPSIYRPPVRQFEAVNGPLTSPRHYLYDALFDAALRFGASTIVDGAFGEMTVRGIFRSRRPVTARFTFCVECATRSRCDSRARDGPTRGFTCGSRRIATWTCRRP
jgi:asparagine synthase (glutamine-hydrolysing)